MNLQTKPSKRKKTTKANSSSSLPLPPPSFSLLPDEITENFLARVPRWYYPKLLLVSKTFRSILSSSDIYIARSRFGSTEQCLYLCLMSSVLDPGFCQSFQWIALWTNPNPTEKKKKMITTIGDLSIPISSSNYAMACNPIVAGSEIYVIGDLGAHRIGALSSSVRVLDCRSHTWRNAPSMIVPRKYHVSCVYDGKIYVFGGIGAKSSSSSPFGEVFDIKNQTWERLPEPGFGFVGIRHCFISQIAEVEGKIYIGKWGRVYAYYDPKQCKWEGNNAPFPSTEVVIDNVSYSLRKHDHDGRYNLWWRDVRGGVIDEVKEVKGLDSLGNRYKRHCGSSDGTAIKTICCDGKLYIIWVGCAKKNNPNNTVKIYCAKISVEKRDGDEIWGNIEWLDVVHTAASPAPRFLLHCLVISL